MFHNWIPQQILDPTIRRNLIRFCITGLITAIVYLLLCFLLVDVIHFSAELSGFISFIAILPLNYLLHKLWSFESRHMHRKTIPKFATVIALGMLINSVLIHLLLIELNIHYLYIQFIAMCLVIIWNFGMFKWWVFQP